MKQFRLIFLALFVLSIVIYGCTTSSVFPLGERSEALPIDESMLGTWQADSSDADAKEITIRKSSATNIYVITVNEKGEFYDWPTDKFDAWVIELKDRQFLVLQEVMGEKVKESYQAYQVSSKGNKFTSYDIKLLGKGADDIRSVADFQKKTIASMNKPGFIDDTNTWTRKK